MHLYAFKSTFENFPDEQNQFRDKLLFPLSTFQGDFKLHRCKPMQDFFLNFFYYLQSYLWIYVGMYTLSLHHFKTFLVSKINFKQDFCFNF